MSKFRTYLAYGIKKLWTTLAVLLVLSAVAISLLRFSLPYLDKNKHLVEDYISENYKADLKIESISADWADHGPSLVLNNVTLLDSENQAIELSIGRVFVELNFWDSILTMSVQSNQFELNRASLIVNTHLMSELSENDQSVVTVISDLFLERLQRFSISDSRLTINTELTSESYGLRTVSWMNSGDRHQAIGQFRDPEIANNSARFVLDLNGESASLSGTFFVGGDDLDLSPWFNELINEQQTLLESRGNFTLWASIADSSIESIQMALKPSQFAWESQDENVLNSSIQQGLIYAEPDAGGWNFNIRDLVFSANGQSMTSNFTGRVLPSGHVNIASMGEIDMAPLIELMPLFVSETQADSLKRLAPTGALKDFHLQSRNTGVSLMAKAGGLSWQGSGALPGLENLNADIAWYKNQGRIQLYTENSVLDSQNLLEDAIDIEAFNASIYVTPERQEPGQVESTPGWIISANDVSFISNKVEFTQQVSYRTNSKHLLLATQVSSLPVEKVPELFPEHYMGSETKRYLTRALESQPSEESATVQHANIVWQGKVDSFPFDKHQGVFQAGVAISGADFLFSEKWPELSDLNIHLLFENDTLTMRSPSSQLSGVDLSNLVATIPSLSEAEDLYISATANATGEALRALMRSSQLADSLGKVLDNEVVLHGDVAAELSLSIPLDDEQVKASGVLSLANNQVDLPSVDLSLSDATGEITFVNDKVTVEQLNAILFNQPIQVALDGEQIADAYQTDITIDGDWLTDRLLADYFPTLDSYVDGVVGINAQLTLVTSPGAFEYDAVVEGDLSDAVVALPAPFTDGIAQFSIDVSGDNQASVVELSSDSGVYFSGVLPHQEMVFSRAHIALGSEFIGSMGGGFSIAAEVDELDLVGWTRFVDNIVGGVTNSDKAVLNTPERILINADNLTFGDNRIVNARLQAKLKNNDWHIDLTSKQIQAELFLDDNWQSRGITLNAEFMRFEELNWGVAEEREWSISNLPPLSLRCEVCKFGRYDLGKVVINGMPRETGYVFDQISLTNAHGQLTATGTWDAQSEFPTTGFTGVVTSDDFGQLLETAGIQSGIKDSEAQFDFSVSWPNAPWELEVGAMEGNVDWELTDGYITELSDQGSRIFTLFSLNSLVRKLSLDFRDVFAQGFFYDDIQGSLQIADGKILTDDTVVDGGAGEITIDGYTNLVNSQLNYQVSFTPNVTGNLPILMYFMVNPPTALAALALDQVLTSAKVISNVNYTVSGTLQNPVVEEVDRDSTEISLPARTSPDGNVEDDESFVPPEPVSVETRGIDG